MFSYLKLYLCFMKLSEMLIMLSRCTFLCTFLFLQLLYNNIQLNIFHQPGILAFYSRIFVCFFFIITQKPLMCAIICCFMLLLYIQYFQKIQLLLQNWPLYMLINSTFANNYKIPLFICNKFDKLQLNIFNICNFVKV